MIDLIEQEEWELLAKINKEVKPLLTNNCNQQLLLYDQYLTSINIQNTDSAKVVLTLLIANSILLELETIVFIADRNSRKQQIKNLFAELISIQFVLQGYNFDLYKSLFSSIKKMHSMYANQLELKRILKGIPQYKNLNITCR